MFGLVKPSLTLRIGWGKILGIVIGIIGFLLLPKIVPDIEMTFRIGILLWHANIGAVIGVFGVYKYQPIINMKLPWWWRGTLIGAWFNLLLMLFIYDKLGLLMANFFGSASFFASPWWIVVEGAIVGFALDGILTRIAGEGPESIDAGT